MKRAVAGLLFLLSSVAWATDDAKPTPMPRVKLDPESYKAVSVATPSAGETNFVPATTAVMMDRFVVQDQGLMFLLRRQAEAAADPKGKFNWRDGGRFYRRDKGPFRLEVGFWTHVNVMAADAAFTGAKHEGFDVLRIKW